MNWKRRTDYRQCR